LTKIKELQIGNDNRLVNDEVEIKEDIEDENEINVSDNDAGDE